MKNRGPTPPQRDNRTNPPTLMYHDYDCISDELEDILSEGTGIEKIILVLNPRAGRPLR